MSGRPETARDRARKALASIRLAPQEDAIVIVFGPPPMGGAIVDTLSSDSHTIHELRRVIAMLQQRTTTRSNPPAALTRATLERDLRYAIWAARASVSTLHDGGSSNFDACAVVLPRAAWVAQAIESVGLHAHKGSGIYRGCWLLSPPSHGQGYRRTKQAKAMTAHLQKLGYTAYLYSRVD